MYSNYHKHDYYTNIIVPDSPVSPEDYAKRAVELGHKLLSSVNHGWAGRYIEHYELAKKYNLKFLFGTEAYFVKDRTEKDRTNAHIVLLAKNENGRKNINRILSEANQTGFYYRARIDLPLIFSLPKDDVWVTSACFTENMIVTAKDGYKKISDINISDKVFTHLGRFEEVESLIKRTYSGRMFSLDIEGCFDTIECTEDHLFPTISYKKEGQKYEDEILWKKANELNLTDRILSAIPKTENYKDKDFFDIAPILKEYRESKNYCKVRNKINTNHIKIDDLFLTVLGLFAAEGHYASKNFSINFTLHEDKTFLHDIINTFSMKYLGMPAKKINKKNSKAVTVTINSKEMCLVFRDLINGGAQNKNIPSFVKNLPPYKQMSFAKGAILGDGHRRRVVARNGRIPFGISFCSISRDLAYGIRDIFENNSIKIGCYNQKGKVDKNKVNHKKSYILEISSEEFYNYWVQYEKTRDWFLFEWDDQSIINPIRVPFIIQGKKYITKRIRSIKPYQYNGDVLCINVKNDHSFKVDGINVHNCLGGLWKYESYEEIIKSLSDHFGNNFFIEVQNHNTEKQADLNKLAINMSNKYNIPLIFGTDSHYIYPSQMSMRDDYLASKHMVYENEENWYMDYPDKETAIKRFESQGILSNSQIKEAIENTNIFLGVEEYTSDIFNKDMKLPTFYPELSQDERNKKFKNLVWNQWKTERNNIPKEKWHHYLNEIKKEVDTIVSTNMSDYFLLDYEVAKKSKEMGGQITMTGRGSMSGFYLCRLLGLTTIDRISAPIKLFPERFITKERILEAKTLPDIDLNLGNPEVFAKAQKEVLGENHSFPMIAYGTMKPKAAWKMYARSQNIDFETANEISSQIENYEMKKKHSDNESEIDILDFIDEEYKEVFHKSESYIGIISDSKVHPCGSLIYQKNIAEEIGLIKIKENLCCCLDGLWGEKYGFLKNDLLKVAVVNLIYEVYKRIGREPHSFTELIELTKNDQKVWDMYKNASTMGLNQVEQTSTKGRVAKYAPQNISELSAFVAAIRPGFQSNYKQFENRESFSYGVDAIDNLIQTEDFPQSYLLYQENAMQILEFAGIPVSKTYEIIKNIAKKRVEKVLAYKEQFINGMNDRLIELEKINEDKAHEISNNIWKIIEDSSHYSFNACVSGDTTIQRSGNTKSRWFPTIEEMFKVKNDLKYAKKTGHEDLHRKYRLYGYGNALSMCKDGRIRKNKIIDIYYSGKRKTYTITTKSGASISCTANHKFPTPMGNKKLSELSIGDYLYIKGKYEKTNFGKKRWFSKNGKSENFPNKGQTGFQEKDYSPSKIYSNIRNFYASKSTPCSICNTKYNKNFELHHKDNNVKNNSNENLLWVCNSCHKKLHYEMGRVKVFEKGIPSELDKIVSIEYSKEEDVYDIEMEAPNHNFISESGLVTSNSHAYSVAGDSLYGAYLKANYPLEFYEVFLQILEENGEKDRLSEAIKEAEKHFGIRFPVPKFRQDNRKISANKKENSITSSLTSIKGMNKKISKNLYEAGKKQFDGFLDFLIYCEENSMISSKFKDLILIDYFSEFGNNKKLYEFFIEFTEGKNKYGKKYIEKTKKNRIEKLDELWYTIPDSRFSLIQQISNEEEILGYIKTKYPNISKRYVYVLQLNTKFSPRMQTYCLNNGVQASLKIQKSIYENNLFNAGEILYLKHFIKKPTVSYQNGKFVKNYEEHEYWVDSYDIIDFEEFEKRIKDENSN